MKNKFSIKNISIIFAILAAVLYAINIPLSKLLLKDVGPISMAGFLYLGAGVGMLVYALIRLVIKKPISKEKLTKKELPFTIAMVVLDIAAPILLMYGIKYSNSANVSLLSNFEIVATTLIAAIIFKEVVSTRLKFAMIFIIIASVVLGFEGIEAFNFNLGSLLVLGACICWGFENNCTRKISNKSSEEIVIIKGIFSGLSSIIVALIIQEKFPPFYYILLVMLLGFVSHGLSINFYVMAQKNLGAAKTSAYYSIAPFVGALLSLIILNERPDRSFYAALVIMIIATILIIHDNIAIQHSHLHTHVHCHIHRHGNLVHCHPHEHSHTHLHVHEANGSVHQHSLDENCMADHHHSHEHLDQN